MGHSFFSLSSSSGTGLLAVDGRGDCCQRVRLPCSSVRVSAAPIASVEQQHQA
ncbi:hypothetical protein ACVXHB_23260 [Escherichia coli]